MSLATRVDICDAAMATEAIRRLASANAQIRVLTVMKHYTRPIESLVLVDGDEKLVDRVMIIDSSPDKEWERSISEQCEAQGIVWEVVKNHPAFEQLRQQGVNQ